MRSAASVANHEVLVSAALVKEEAIDRALGLRALPPARFREPIPLDRRAAVFAPQASPPRARRNLVLFSAGLAVISLAIAGWNLYWLAGPLHRALLSLVG
jgi:hypothetical protein